MPAVRHMLVGEMNEAKGAGMVIYMRVAPASAGSPRPTNNPVAAAAPAPDRNSRRDTLMMYSA